MIALAAIGIMVAITLLVLLCWGIGGFILQWAWNIALVPLFHLPLLGFWPAVGIVVLLSFIPKLININVEKKD